MTPRNERKIIVVSILEFCYERLRLKKRKTAKREGGKDIEKEVFFSINIYF
jgi:hypothetical protein